MVPMLLLKILVLLLNTILYFFTFFLSLRSNLLETIQMNCFKVYESIFYVVKLLIYHRWICHLSSISLWSIIYLSKHLFVRLMHACTHTHCVDPWTHLNMAVPCSVDLHEHFIYFLNIDQKSLRNMNGLVKLDIEGLNYYRWAVWKRQVMLIQFRKAWMVSWGWNIFM